MTAFLELESPGLHTTVQDLGRYGYAHLGISPAGAADQMALRIGNLLVGNDEGEAALELTLQGGAYRFSEDAVVAITGSHSPAWKALQVTAGERLVPPADWSGARCYLAVRGGLDVPLVLGSRSTHIPSRVGGNNGRPLDRGDRIGIAGRIRAEPRWEEFQWPIARRSVLRVTAGPQAHWFGSDFYQRTFEVKGDSDRMGVRLRGVPVEVGPPRPSITEGASLGAVQVPPGGEPIVLFVDHQTTGGYPKIANVISADLWRVGQLRPRDRVRFELVGIDEALNLLRRQERIVESLR
jgi:antagonist of KipI